METPFFFDGPSGPLFGVLHEPSGDRGREPYVMCHPFAEEKLWAHRVFVTFARALAAAGHAVLRFDYAGNGDSHGEFEASSVESAVADTDAAVEVLQRKGFGPRVGLIGLRFGAAVAASVAARRQDVSALVLWSPIVDGASYLQELLRINLATQMAIFKEVRRDRQSLVATLEGGGTVNIDGYELSPEMYRQLAAFRLADLPAIDNARELIVQIDRSAGAASPALTELARTRSAERLAVVQEEPFWKEIRSFYDDASALRTHTLEWIAQPCHTPSTPSN